MSEGHALWRVAPDHPALAGHFPGRPIVPGAVLLSVVLDAIGPPLGPACCGLAAAKFHHPVRPGDCVAIVWDAAGEGDIRFVCTLVEGGTRVLSGALRRDMP